MKVYEGISEPMLSDAKLYQLVMLVSNISVIAHLKCKSKPQTRISYWSKGKLVQSFYF